MPDDAPAQGKDAPDAIARAAATMRSRRYLTLLALITVVGIVVSVAAWCFVELTHQLNRELFTHLPHALGYSSGPPVWWPLPVLAVSGALTGFAIDRLPEVVSVLLGDYAERLPQYLRDELSRHLDRGDWTEHDVHDVRQLLPHCMRNVLS